MVQIGIITGSTRPNRRSPMVSTWVHSAGDYREDLDLKVIDLADLDLPMYNEPVPAAVGAVQGDAAIRWGDILAEFDGYIFVVPEYNHSYPAVIKNALDLAFTPWNDKVVGFVSYGLHGGVRAVEHLRSSVSELKLASVRTSVALSLFTDFTLTDMTEPGEFTPADHQIATLDRMFDELVSWGAALASLRTKPDSHD